MSKITYNQFKPEEVTFGDTLKNFIKEYFPNGYNDIVVHFENETTILVDDTTQLYCKLMDYSTGNWNPDAITSIEVRRPEYSNAIQVEAIHW